MTEIREQNPPVSPRAAYALMSFTIVIWASAFAGLRYVLRQVDSVTMTALRLFIAAGFMGAVLVVMHTRIPERRDWPKLVAASLLGFSVYHYLLNVGTETITAGQASFVVSTIPVWAALLAWRFLGEKLSLKNWAGLFLAVAGVGLMSLDLSSGDASLSIGSWFVLGAAVCAGANIVICKDLLARYRAVEVAAYGAIIGALPFLLHLPWTYTASADLELSGWLVLAYLGIIPIGLGYWLSSIALAALPANHVAQMLLLIPPVAAVIAWLTIAESPPEMLFVGGPLILIGVFLGRQRE